MQRTRSTLVSFAAAALVIASCGGSDGADSSGPQAELADTTVDLLEEFAAEDGIDVSEDCVRDLISDLSDEEAAAGLAALNDPDSDSDAFDAVGERIEDECFN